ncbi:MAG: hypothetical protein M1119_02950 [Firmicutes bacterium]|nr:hypothetical protein [Bacillota bacterium]
MAKKEKDQGLLEGTAKGAGDFLEEVGTELGLTEQPKVRKEKNKKIRQ